MNPEVKTNIENRTCQPKTLNFLCAKARTEMKLCASEAKSHQEAARHTICWIYPQKTMKKHEKRI